MLRDNRAEYLRSASRAVRRWWRPVSGSLRSGRIQQPVENTARHYCAVSSKGSYTSQCARQGRGAQCVARWSYDRADRHDAGNSLVALPRYAEMEKRICELAAQGLYDDQIVQILADDGHRSPWRGTAVLPSTVRGIRLRHGIKAVHGQTR
jgi:hypothetical protein